MSQANSFDDDGSDVIGRPALARPILVTEEDEREFCRAIEEYKQLSGRLFPTWSEILEVLQSLGYAKRIWKPVRHWAPLSGQGIGEGAEGLETVGVVGWFARVETPAGP